MNVKTLTWLEMLKWANSLESNYDNITLNNTPKLKQNTIWSLNFTTLKTSRLDSCRFLFFWRPYLWSSPGKKHLPFASPPMANASSPVKWDRIAFRGHEYCSLIVVGCIPCCLPAGNEAWATPANESYGSRNLNLVVLPISIGVKLGRCQCGTHLVVVLASCTAHRLFETWDDFLFLCMLSTECL